MSRERERKEGIIQGRVFEGSKKKDTRVKNKQEETQERK